MRQLTHANWFASRVGAVGRGWISIRTALLRHLPTPREATRLGLDDVALETLAARHQFDRLATLFPTRGDAAGLRRIARFGSQLAAIACIAAGLDPIPPLLIEGARFNLGVALFDTIVDDDRRHLGEAAVGLAPVLIHGHLVEGVPLPRSRDPGVELVIDLFRALFASVRERATAPHLSQLSDALSAMYISEVSEEGDPLAAKILPTRFFGQLVAPDEWKVLTLMQRLGAFVARIDDWQDLPADIVAERPNAFLGGNVSTASTQYTALRLWRVVGGRVSHWEIGRRLALALDDVLIAARRAGPGAEAASVAFVRGLLGASA
jgi:hypothetical protein